MDTPSSGHGSGHGPVPLDPRLTPKKSMFVLEDGRNVLFVFSLLILLFALWGFCNGMIDAMDKPYQDAQGLENAWRLGACVASHHGVTQLLPREITKEFTNAEAT